jgi:thioesterase domain-containing protein
MLLLRGAARLKYLAKWAANAGVLLSRALGWREDSSLARATRKVAAANTRAIMAYKPKPYAGKLVQFMCSDGAYRSYEDRRLGWSNLAIDGLEVHLVPGDHLTMVEEPNVRTLAQELQRCLDRVSGVSGSKVQKAEELRSPKSAGATQVHVSIPMLTSVGDLSRAPGL